MAMNYRCQNERRRKQVLKDVVRNLNGIDYLEVDSGQRSLKVYFLRSLPSLPITALKKENIIIEGGVRIKDIKVDSVNSINNILTVNVSKSGDFSIYTLRLFNADHHMASIRCFQKFRSLSKRNAPAISTANQIYIANRREWLSLISTTRQKTMLA